MHNEVHAFWFVEIKSTRVKYRCYLLYALLLLRHDPFSVLFGINYPAGGNCEMTPVVVKKKTDMVSYFVSGLGRLQPSEDLFQYIL